MSPILGSFLNLFDGGNLIIIGIIGLLLFGKDMPVMARRAAKEYFRYKRLITEATSDIRREMESAADQIEEEKRKIQHDLEKEMNELNDEKRKLEKDLSVSLSDGDKSSTTDGNGSSADGNGTTYPYGDTPPEAPRISQTPPKPAANPLALDVPTPSTHRVTEAAKSPVESAAQLDKPQK